MKAAFYLCGTMLSAFCMTAPAAYAQNTDSSDAAATSSDDIIVTARRREESLQDVPVTIAALSGEELAKRGVNTVSDLQYQVPGLQLSVSSRNQTTPSVSLRGQRQSDVSPSTDPAVGIYFAEVPIARPNGVNGSLFDMQSVQVLKGPQGTLFGRNTTGGAILFTPNAPQPEFGAMGQLTLGSYGLRDLEGMLNVPFSDAIMLRVSGKMTRRDGYVKNLLTGKRGGDIHNDALRGYLRIQPTSTITSDFIGSYFKSSDNGTMYKLIGYNTATFPIPPLRPAFEAQAQAALKLGKFETQSLPFVWNDGRIEQNYSKVKALTLQNTTSLDLTDNITVKNIFGYRDTQSSGTFNLGPIASLRIVQTNAQFEMKQITDEFQVQGSGSELNWIVGLFYFKEWGSDNSPSNQFSPFVTYTSDAKIKNVSKSVFAHFDYTPEWLSNLTIAGGIRWNKDDRRTSVKSRSPLGSATLYRCNLEGPPPTVITSLNGEACPRRTANADFKKVTYDVSLNYKLATDIMAYGTYRRGYRSGALFSRPGNLASLNTPTRPEVVDDFEFGLKSQFDLGSVNARFNAAYFHSKYDNVQRSISTIVNGTQVGAYINAAKATIDGLEFDLGLRFSNAFTIDANYAYLDPKYKKFQDLGAGGVVVDISDSPFAYAPKHAVNVSARYQLPIAEKDGQLSVQANYYWQSKTVTNDNATRNCAGGAYPACINADLTVMPSYATVNARIDWEHFQGSNVDLGFFVNNLTNKYYWLYRNSIMEQLGTAFGLPAAPRMYGVQIRYRY